MRTMLALPMIALASFVGCGTGGDLIPDGTYYGYEPMINVSPDQPNACWFHENVLTVKGKAIRIETRPYFQIGPEVSSSASDGGFFTFEGSQVRVSGRTLVSLRLISCDYCGCPGVRT